MKKHMAKQCHDGSSSLKDATCWNAHIVLGPHGIDIHGPYEEHDSSPYAIHDTKLLDHDISMAKQASDGDRWLEGIMAFSVTSGFRESAEQLIWKALPYAVNVWLPTYVDEDGNHIDMTERLDMPNMPGVYVDTAEPTHMMEHLTASESLGPNGSFHWLVDLESIYGYRLRRLHTDMQAYENVSGVLLPLETYKRQTANRN